MKHLALAVLLLSVGCGKSKPADKPAEPVTAAASANDALAAFESMFTPRWNAEPGEQRKTDACGDVEDFLYAARDIHAAAAPTGVDAVAWTTTTEALVDAAGALDHDCTDTGGASFDTSFSALNDAYHRVANLVP